jgi:hypothetical protein
MSVEVIRRVQKCAPCWSRERGWLRHSRLEAMSEYIPGDNNPHDLPKRAVRALTEKMTVLPDTGRVKNADDLYLIVSGSGSEYLVDAREGRCDCPDAQHNLDADDRCKHERRVEYATGQRPIQTWVNVNAIDPQLGMHTEETTAHDATAAPLSERSPGTPTPVPAITDGGVKPGEAVETGASGSADTDAPQYTYHIEPPHVGGERYVRCEECGSESIPADPERVLHREGCSEGDR